MPRISVSDSHYCQLHALIMHYSHQAAVQENTSLKMLLFSENSIHGCSSWGHVQQAGSIHVRARERDEALPTLSGLNSHSDILRSWYRCPDAGFGSGFCTVLFLCVSVCYKTQTGVIKQSFYESQQCLCVSREASRKLNGETVPRLPSQRLRLWQVRAQGPVYEAALLVAPFSLMPPVWSAEEATPENAPFALGLLYSLGNSAF